MRATGPIEQLQTSTPSVSGAMGEAVRCTGVVEVLGGSRLDLALGNA